VRPLTLYFHGPRGAGKRDAAEALAGEVGAPLLVADLGRALARSRDFEQALKLLFREAWFRGAVLYLSSLDVLRKDERSLEYEQLLDALVEDEGITILSGTQPWAPLRDDAIGVVSVPFSVPDFRERRAWWQARLDGAGIRLRDDELDQVAARLRLTRSQISEAVAAACNRRGATPGPPEPQTLDGQDRRELVALARMQCGHELAALAKRIEPLYRWEDIVLPADALAQLREICQRVVHRDRVLGEWGFDRKLSGGKGVNALFAGPSGTGKTMAAEIIARELELDLYRIDLSGVVSKYIGETEKNLDRVFHAAETANAILFFDEADALFGKRSEVRDSHDRYANVEISYLLQKMEEYEGVAILATNLRQNLDESFVRRLAFTVHFPFPDERDRRRIWSGIWPAETPVAEELDLDSLAHHFRLSGGNIKNVALAAAFLAASDGGSVTMAHVIQATRREYQKLGKPLSEADLAPFTAEAAP
jgi:SpoVK/Ycf46/Vps4 family AAA+-type ATPase